MKNKTIHFASTLLLTAYLCLPLVSQAQTATLDPSFDADGIVVTPVSSTASSEARSIVIQSDGKIIAAGSADNGIDYDFAMTRYNTDGSLDNTFDTDGIVTTNIGTSSSDFAYSVALQSDGKVVVVGNTYNGTDDDLALVRYNADGSLDNTFDSDGIVITNISASSNDYAYSVALQSDGKIVVTGFTNNGNDDDLLVMRYNANGSLDNTFDTDGIITTNISTTSNDYAFSVKLQVDGKIVVVGYTIDSTNFSDFALTRYNTNGSLDNTFDTDGIVTTNISTTSNDYAYSVAVQSDGKIVVTGSTDNSIDYDFAVTRYNMNGSLDNTFDTDGIVVTNISTTSNDYAYSVALQSDGKIIVAGPTYNGNNFDFYVVRYNTDGSLDNTFDSDGIDTTDINGLDNSALAVAIQSDGKIVVAGSATNNSSFYTDFAVIRYNATSIGINTDVLQTSDVNFYPNPFSTQTILQTENSLQNATLTMYNSSGQQVKEITGINGQTITLLREDLPVGMYFVQIMENGKITSPAKLIITQ